MKKPRIKYSYTYINFRNWLKNNYYKFPTRPQIIELRSDSFSLVFPRVRNLKIIFKSHGWVEVWVWKDKNYIVDILTDFDLDEEKGEQGYFCDSCHPRDYYQDRKDLWEKHVYEPLLEWSIKIFLPENYLCLYETEYMGSSWTKILPFDKIESDKELKYRVYCESIFRAKV
ncbi:MAG: hypothetical protein PHY93_20845 [Bacteriovorax sp.]|nr:hypothetical protein [Bacteriovorax sp.]